MVDEFEKMHNTSCDYINFSIAAFMIRCYSFLQMNVENYVKKMYTYEPIKNIANKIYYFAYIIKSKFINYYTEPIDIFWTCIAYTELDYKNTKYNYDDYYPRVNFETNKDQDHNILEAYNALYDTGNFQLTSDVGYAQIYERLVLLKYYNKCTSRICTLTNSKSDMNLAPSFVRFLSLVYSHPKMKDTIHLKIDNMYYLIDNEILSPVFILRLLKYQYQTSSFEFDKDYKLEVMDDNVNIINLTSDKYICLKEDKYEVLNV